VARIVQRGNSIQIRAYAGVDPATGKPERIVRTVAADTGKRELDRLMRAVQAEADALAQTRRERRRDPKTRGTAPPPADAVAPEDVTFRIAAEAWYKAHADQLERSGRQTPRLHLDCYLYPHIGDVALWRFRGVIDRAVVHDPDLVSFAELWATLMTNGKVKRKKDTNGNELPAGGLGRETLQRTRGVARQVFAYALTKGWGNLTGNPVIDAPLPKATARVSTTPQADDAAAFFAQLADDSPMLYAFGLFVASGPRPTEVYPLRWSALDLEAGTAKVGQEGAIRVWETDPATGQTTEQFVIESGDTHKRRRRRIRLDPVTVDALKTLRKRAATNVVAAGVTLDDDAFVFTPTVDGSAMYGGSWAGRAFGRAVERARKDGYRLPDGIRLYDVRHLAITTALENGHPVADVAQRFGTSARTIYARYAHAIPGNDEKIAASMGAVWKAHPGDDVRDLRGGTREPIGG
jgi:integrase